MRSQCPDLSKQCFVVLREIQLFFIPGDHRCIRRFCFVLGSEAGFALQQCLQLVLNQVSCCLSKLFEQCAAVVFLCNGDSADFDDVTGIHAAGHLHECHACFIIPIPDGTLDRGPSSVSGQDRSVQIHAERGIEDCIRDQLSIGAGDDQVRPGFQDRVIIGSYLYGLEHGNSVLLGQKLDGSGGQHPFAAGNPVGLCHCQDHIGVYIQQGLQHIGSDLRGPHENDAFIPEIFVHVLHSIRSFIIPESACNWDSRFAIMRMLLRQEV